MPETFDPMIGDLHQVTGGTGPPPQFTMRDTKTGKIIPRGSKIGKWFGRGIGPRLQQQPQFQALLNRERARRANQAIAPLPQAPQATAVNKTGSSAARHGQAQPIKKKQKTTAQTSARRSALLFDQGGGGLG